MLFLPREEAKLAVALILVLVAIVVIAICSCSARLLAMCSAISSAISKLFILL
jgi:hypothetical protein